MDIAALRRPACQLGGRGSNITEILTGLDRPT